MFPYCFRGYFCVCCALCCSSSSAIGLLLVKPHTNCGRCRITFCCAIDGLLLWRRINLKHENSEHQSDSRWQAGYGFGLGGCSLCLQEILYVRMLLLILSEWYLVFHSFSLLGLASELSCVASKTTKGRYVNILHVLSHSWLIDNSVGSFNSATLTMRDAADGLKKMWCHPLNLPGGLANFVSLACRND